MKHIPNISKSAFWDIHFDQIDRENNKEYLIIKIIERGTFDDLLEMINFYGDAQIKYELCNASKLPERTYYFALTYFDLNINDFACCITRLLETEI